MVVHLLGTGAAEGVPALYSGSRVSQYAREHGGKDVRTRSAALIDGALKIDLGPDTLMQSHRDHLDPRDWSGVIFTHGDDDHCSPRELQYGLYPFNEMEYLGFTLYGNDRVCDRIRSTYPDWPIECVQTRSFEAFQHAEFVVTPIEANHNRKEDCQNHIIQRAGKALLYATDTGVWRAPTWNFLKDFRLDALVIECTEGLCATGFDGHLDLFECAEVVARLRAQGSLNPKARVVTTHHSHLGNATHGELTKALAPHGIEPGFDGMVFEL